VIPRARSLEFLLTGNATIGLGAETIYVETIERKTLMFYVCVD
jgi:hypothetical protein